MPSRHYPILPLLGLALLPLVFSTTVWGEDALLDRYQRLSNGIMPTLPGTMINIVSTEHGEVPSAEVSSILPTPFTTVAPALSRADNWCQFMPLHFNIKACTYKKSKDGEVLTVYSGRKTYQPPEDSYKMTYRFETIQSDDNRLSLHLRADQGPANTRDYRIALDALQVEEGTLIHIESSYRPSLLSSILTHSYLATLGHNKVGFSRIEQDGELHFVQGIRGIIERNVMRYQFAVNAFIGSLSLPAGLSRHDAALQRWFEENERYPQQLHEMPEAEYLTIKRKERKNQLRLQQAANRQYQLAASP